MWSGDKEKNFLFPIADMEVEVWCCKCALQNIVLNSVETFREKHCT